MASIPQQPLLARRQFLTGCGLGLGNLALHGLLGEELAPKTPQFPPRARRIVQLFMGGAPSQFELFADTPDLARLEG